MHHLTAGLAALSPNDFGRPWPSPRRVIVARLVGEFDADLCVYAAVETRQIVQSQDRAPKITALFEKKLRDLAAERAYESEVRAAVQAALVGGER